MSTKITIDVSKTDTNIAISENATELDIYLAVAGLFDLLSTKTKRNLISGLEKGTLLEENTIGKEFNLHDNIKIK